MALPVRPLSANAPRHIVEFYDDDRDLVDGVARFLGEGLDGGEVAVIVATAEHRAGIADALDTSGVDFLTSRAEGRYLEVDIDDLMLTFMRDGRPVRKQFHTAVGGLIRRARRWGRPVRVFGEMVGLLWTNGEVNGAIELEALWNELGQQHDFQLYCAYPMSSMDDDADLAAARNVCDLHTGVVTPPSYESDDPSAALIAPPTAVTASHVFVPVPLAARAVRRFVRATLRAWGDETVIDDAQLVASELTTNALLHAASPFRITVARVDGAIRIEVHDADTGRPEHRDLFGHTTSGRGVAIVAELSRGWGTVEAAGGKIVWTELSLDPTS